MDPWIIDGMSPDRLILPPVNHREPKDTNENEMKRSNHLRKPFNNKYRTER